MRLVVLQGIVEPGITSTMMCVYNISFTMITSQDMWPQMKLLKLISWSLITGNTTVNAIGRTTVMFGGVERGICNAFMVEFQDWSATTLAAYNPTACSTWYRLVHTTVLSDEWKAYRQALLIRNTVPTGAHTRSIESTWAQTKRMMRKSEVMATSANQSFPYLPTYLQENLWRKKFQDSDPLTKILDHIQEQYPLP